MYNNTTIVGCCNVTVVNRNINGKETPTLKVNTTLNLTKAMMLTFLFLASTVFSFAQTPAAEAKAGTYQLIFPTERNVMDVHLTAAQLAAIENLRKDDVAVYAVSASNDYLQIKILPRNLINSEGFKAPEKVIYKADMTADEIHAIRYVEIQ